jgi:tRNA A-37 threonylcarbamoyl transferase component Bud32
MKCSGVRKAQCLPPHCDWIVGKGCRKSKQKTPTKRKSIQRKSSSKQKQKSPKSPKRKSPNKSPCYKFKKANCTSPNCQWVVGKGCKKGEIGKKKTPTPKVLEQQIIEFFDHPKAQITEMGSCLQDIIVENYLARGAYGAVYAIRYKGKECVMKVVVEKPVKLSGIRNIRGHQMKYAKEEADTLKKASKLGIGPTLYDFRICEVKIPYVFGDKKIKIGIFILERLEMTLYDYYEALIQKLQKIKERKKFEREMAKADKQIQSINEKIQQDCYLAQKNGLGILDMHTGNIMINKSGVPIISDWGIAGSGGKEDCVKYFNRNNKEWNYMKNQIYTEFTSTSKSYFSSSNSTSDF